MMAAVRSRGNRNTEAKLAMILREAGITGWRRHVSTLPGRPDFSFRRERIALFIDGCFWHGCPKHCRMPKSRLDYWQPKIFRNRARDLEVKKLLHQKGWQVCRIWEHSLNKPRLVVSRLHILLSNSLQVRSDAKS
jgi:DNA mismatch endonuclease (patch repair protein)